MVEPIRVHERLRTEHFCVQQGGQKRDVRLHAGDEEQSRLAILAGSELHFDLP
jgi:hypothetical protein